MKKRLVALLLVLIFCVSALAVTVSAAEKTYTVTIDLTNYKGTVQEAYLKKGNTKIEDWKSQLKDKKKKTFTYSYDREAEGSSQWLCVRVTLDPVQSWTVGDNTYTTTTKVASGFPNKKNEYQFKDAKSWAIVYLYDEADGDVSYNIAATSKSFAEEYELTLKSAAEAQGSVESLLVGDNQYTLTAKAADGYLFEYWQKTGSEDRITENPHTVTLTENETWTAYFRKPYQATVEVAEGCEGMGTVNASYVSGDMWYIRATANKGFGFTGWSGGSDPTSDGLNVTLEKDTTFTANFVRSQVTKITDIRLYVEGQAENPDDSAVETTDDSTDVQTE